MKCKQAEKGVALNRVGTAPNGLSLNLQSSNAVCKNRRGSFKVKASGRSDAVNVSSDRDEDGGRKMKKQ